MPRQLRVEYPGAIYHIMSRGDRKKDIHLDEVDRQDFLKTLAEACHKSGFQVHAYCLMEQTDERAWQPLRRGWCLGSEAFREKLLAKMEPHWGEHHSGQLHYETAVAKAEWIIAEEMQRAGWAKNDLSEQAKSHPVKLAIALRLREETSLTIRQIAERLKMGSWKSVNNQLYLAGKAKGGKAKK